MNPYVSWSAVVPPTMNGILETAVLEEPSCERNTCRAAVTSRGGNALKRAAGLTGCRYRARALWRGCAADAHGAATATPAHKQIAATANACRVLLVISRPYSSSRVMAAEKAAVNYNRYETQPYAPVPPHVIQVATPQAPDPRSAVHASPNSQPSPRGYATTSRQRAADGGIVR